MIRYKNVILKEQDMYDLEESDTIANMILLFEKYYKEGLVSNYILIP